MQWTAASAQIKGENQGQENVLHGAKAIHGKAKLPDILVPGPLVFHCAISAQCSSKEHQSFRQAFGTWRAGT
jgi:hypothetical protein